MPGPDVPGSSVRGTSVPGSGVPGPDVPGPAMLEADVLARAARDFAADGFAVVPNVYSPSHCAALSRRAQELVAELGPRDLTRRSVFSTTRQTDTTDTYFLESGEQIRCFFEEGAFDSQGALRVPLSQAINKLGHAMHDLDPVFDEFSRSPALRQLAAAVGLDQAALMQSMYIFKQPHIGGEVVCHTDHTFLWTDPPSVVGFWVAIETATQENGCLWALPGGHRQPARRRFRRVADDTVGFEELDPLPYPLDGLVPLEADVGTVVLLHGLLPHLSGPNESPRSRHAYTVHAIDRRAQWAADNWLRRDTPPRGF